MDDSCRSVPAGQLSGSDLRSARKVWRSQLVDARHSIYSMKTRTQRLNPGLKVTYLYHDGDLIEVRIVVPACEMLSMVSLVGRSDDIARRWHNLDRTVDAELHFRSR
jgi:hypothetical protein